jgi:hypothetical protein
MDKKVAGLIKDTMGEGEKRAPVKSIKLKVKFQKEKVGYEKKKKELAEKKK